MSQYESKSFEELRYEDYLAGNKGNQGQQQPAAPAGFGGFGAAPQPAPSTGLFGAPAPAPAGGGLFGSPAPATGGLFGAPTTGKTNTTNRGMIEQIRRAAKTTILYLQIKGFLNRTRNSNAIIGKHQHSACGYFTSNS